LKRWIFHYKKEKVIEIKMKNFFKNKRILITGASGTVGKELIKQLSTSLNEKPKEIVGIDQDENSIFFLSEEYKKRNFINFFVTNVCDQQSVLEITKGIDIIFHTAALKHVILGEKNPKQVIRTNIDGLQNVIFSALENNVEKVIFTSSDKAVNPTNVMGTSKLMGEKIITAANNLKINQKTIFSSTRFGNIIGSNGSVVQIFDKQIRKQVSLTITDARMTRFIMSLDQAAKLVLNSARMAKGGEIFVTKMKAISVIDLADAMIDIISTKEKFNKRKIKKIFIGAKPGEKYFEELLSSEEKKRAIELNEFYSIIPAFQGTYRKIKYNYPKMINKKVSSEYNSKKSKLLSKNQIKKLLFDYKLY
jgi:FlaA1/EpsC-like NDP-sugar epimerase